jgi:UDP-N-acetylglucosamine--dolichyl-phosphate N-acetylglucosaminephosphotransferase
LEWKFKIIFPAFSIIPCILLYDGGTSVIIPFIGLYNISYFYYVYMILFSIFCTNSINILSGINGLEVLQVIIISAFLFIDNIIQCFKTKNGVYMQDISIYHFGSTIYLVLLFCSLPLYSYNKFPAKLFVGDTFCYFAGMSLTCVAILCHTTRTLFCLLFVQIINFIVSLPQICGFIHCPRHRMPGFDGFYIIPSTIKYKNKKICNLTLLNIILKCFGKMKEDKLCWVVGYFMMFWCSVVLLLKNFYITK